MGKFGDLYGHLKFYVGLAPVSKRKNERKIQRKKFEILNQIVIQKSIQTFSNIFDI